MSQDEKTKAAFERIKQGVKDVYSSENFKQYLSCLSKFHSYSLNNTLLILSQKPEATLVAGYRSWQNNFNRHVNKGEKGLTILAPVVFKEKREMNQLDENGNVVLDTSGNALKEEREVNITCFKTTTVFDISQTSGEPLPTFLHDLTGSSQEVQALIQMIQTVCTIPIEFKTETEDLALLTSAKGYYSPTTDKIVVNKDLEDLQIAKTLIHEYAHSILHKQTNKTHSQREIEAESLAFVLCDHFGIDTSEYSFGYIASYADKEFDELKSILLNIQSTAHEMIEKIEPIFKEKLQMKEIENKYITPVEMEQLNHDILVSMLPILEPYKAMEGNKIFDVDHLIDQKLIDFLNSDDKYATQAHLFSNNPNYNRTLRSACYNALVNPKFNINQPWFIEHSIERRNYELFEDIAKPLLTNDAYYMKFTSPGFMDLNIEIIDENRLAIAHNFELNGDLMADPDVEFTVDKENRLLYPQTYQQDTLQIYERLDGNPIRINELNQFMNQWFNNITDQHYVVDKVYSENFELSKKENPSAMRKFCKEHDIPWMCPAPKEIER